MTENKCTLCPRNCGIDRSNRKGFCGVSQSVKYAGSYLHQFEEPVISGSNGSGTMFFCGCSLKCPFCQNFELSRNMRGKEISVSELAEIFMQLEKAGAHNINLVNPTHYVLEIQKSIQLFRPKIPVVYNTHSYENIETVEIAKTFTDIFLPDLKVCDSYLSERYFGVKDYFIHASKAIQKMCENNQPIIENGLMKKGVIVRHLILPQCVYDTVTVLKWIKEFLPDNVQVSLMAQYTPFGECDKFSELTRKITRREYDRAVDCMTKLGIKGYIQDLTSSDTQFIPKWQY